MQNEEDSMEANKVEMVRQAMLELGEASSHELAAFIEQRHGVRIETRIMPILKASVRGQEVLERARQAARAATQTAAKPGNDSSSEGAAQPIAESA
jgi:hypothetical protein